MKKFWKILMWILTGLYATFAFAYLIDGSGILCGLIAVIFVIFVVPINRWQLMINKYIKKGYKVIIAVVLAVLFFVAVPSTELENQEDNITQNKTNVTITTPTASSINEVTEPSTELITTPITEPVTELTTTAPQIEQTEPVTEPPMTKPTVKPVVKPTEPTNKPTTAPVTNTSEPTTEPSTPNKEPSKDISQSNSERDYVVNTNTKKFHSPNCSSVKRINDENRWDYHGSRDELIEDGYEPCGKCHP